MANISISGKNIEVGESLKAFAEQELQNAMSHAVEDFLDAQILIKKKQDNSSAHHCAFECEVTVHVARDFSIHAGGHDEDAYACITKAMNTVKQRTRRYKARLRDRMQRQIKKDKEQRLPVEISQFVLDQAQEEENIQETPLIIAEMVDTMQTLSVGDAVMQLDLSEATVLVFENASSGKTNVVYKRADGHIGWIAPK